MASSRVPGVIGQDGRSMQMDEGTMCLVASPLPGRVGTQDTADGLSKEQKELLLDITQFTLDVVGIFEPTPFADGTNAIISAGRGDWLGAGISTVSMIPYLGDLAKTGKLPRYAASLSKAINLARQDVNFARRLRPILQKLADILENVPFSKLPKALTVQLKQITNRVNEFLMPVFKRIWSVRQIQDVAKQVPLNLGDRQVALYFGLGSDAEKMIPNKYASIGRLLKESSGGKRLLENLKDWSAGGKEGWSILSGRLARKAVESGKRVHVFVNKEFHERMFPSPVKLQEWWKGHKLELIEDFNKKLSRKALKQEIRVDQIPIELKTYSDKLGKWTKNEIEAQHYAVNSKNKFSGNYEDEIFHKIERLHLQSAEFHVMEKGREVTSFLQVL